MDRSIISEAHKEEMVSRINDSLDAAFKHIHAVNGEARTIENKIKIMEAIYGLTDELADTVKQCLVGAEVQCRKGCAHCCSFRVEALPVEAINIARHLLDQGKESAQAWAFKLEDHARYAKDRGGEGYRKECPFMDAAGACVIYAVRPYKCRVYHSLDEEKCRTHRKNYQVGLLGQLESMVVQSTVDIFRGEGLALTPSELGHSVLIALRDPACVEKWMGGGNPFL